MFSFSLNYQHLKKNYAKKMQNSEKSRAPRKIFYSQSTQNIFKVDEKQIFLAVFIECCLEFSYDCANCCYSEFILSIRSVFRKILERFWSPSTVIISSSSLLFLNAH